MSGLQLHEPKTSVVRTSFGVRVFGLNMESCNPIGPSHYGDLRYRCTLQVRLQHLRIFLHQFKYRKYLDGYDCNVQKILASLIEEDITPT